MKAKEIIPETLRRPDRENIPYGFGSGAPVGGGIPAGRIEPTLGQIGSQAAQSAARIKSVSPNQPLNAPGQNVWRSGRTGEPMRSPGDKAQNIDDFVMQRAAQGRPLGGPIPIPPAPGERLAGAAGAAVPVAVGAGIYAADKGARPTSGQSTPPANQPPASSTPAASAPRPVTTPAARPATTAPAARRPQQGVVGSELGRLSGGEFATRADRLNQARVDDILGPGYKAGSAAANTALRDYYKANPPMSTPTLPAPELRGAGTGPYGAGPDKGNLSASGAWHGSEMWGDEQLHKGSKNPSADSIDTKESIERILKLAGRR
jgi:hypothetical protein